MRQVGLANTLYQQDFDGFSMPVGTFRTNRGTPSRPGIPNRINWAYLFDFGGVQRKGTGLLMDYVDDANGILECPTNRRRDPRGVPVDPANSAGGEYLYGSSELNFDYTFVAAAQGARDSVQFDVWYYTEPQSSTPVLAGRIFDLARQNGILERMQGLPLIIEESSWWYNNNGSGGVTDGRWGNEDQWTTRHGGGGSTFFQDGRVDIFVPPSEFVNDSPNEARGGTGFTAHNIYVRTRASGSFYRLTDLDSAQAAARSGADNPGFGAVNHPERFR
jgi:hypothetical protein